MSVEKSLEPGHDPGTASEEIKLVDIVDLAQIQELVEVLSQAIGTTAALLDLEGNILAASGWHRICTDFHRVHPLARKACIASLSRIPSDLPRGKFILYKCGNNLWDIGTPVFVEDHRVGNLFISQCFLEDEESDIEVFKSQAEKYGFDEKEYLDALAEVPRISRKKAEWAMALFVKIADYISELGARNLQLARALEKNKALMESLAASESLMRIAEEFAAVGGWQYDVAQDRLEWSEKVAGIHEMPQDHNPNLEENMGFYAPEYRRRVRKVFVGCLRRGKPFDEVMQIVTATGRRVWVRVMGTAVRDGAGKIIRVQGALQDITDRKKTEEALRRSEERFRSIFENATIGIYRTTPGGEILMANPALMAMLGYSSFEELAPRNLNEGGFEPGYDRSQFQEMIDRHGMIRGLQSAWTKRDGSVVHVRESSRAVRDNNGDVLYYEGTVEDITAQKLAEEELKRKDDLIRIASGLASLGGWSVNLPANRTIWTDEAAKIHERPPGFSATMEEAMSFYAPESRPKIEKLYRECLEKGTPYDEEFKKITATGRSIWVQEIGEAVWDDTGKIIGVQGAFQDITERRKLERDYATLFREMLDGFSINRLICDADGRAIDFRFIVVNPAFERITGLKLEDIEGKTVREVFPGIEDHWIQRFGRVALTGEPLFFEDYAGPLGKYLEVKVFRTAPGEFAVISVDITGKKRAEEKLQHALQTTIGVLTQTVERRDPYTAGHQRRVGILAGRIAQEMGLDPERVDQIRMSGFVHDLGKISVPAEILSKPGRLSELEMDIIREHPGHGRDILHDVESDWDLAKIVYQHHERLDGSGYPQGLKGDEISLEARILAVADVVEAMASYRPYRPAIGLEEALEEIENNAGILYDPEAAKVCLDLFRNKGYRLEN
jgi:PAS domain S-box-containing protein